MENNDNNNEVLFCSYPEGWQKVKDEKLTFLGTDEEREKYLRALSISILFQL